MTGDVGSGLVPYGVSNRLPTEEKKDNGKQREERKNNYDTVNVLKQHESKTAV